MLPKSERTHVVVSTKPMGGSRVMCGATSKEDAEATLKRLEVHENTAHLGPFHVTTVVEAERKKLYGD